MPSQVLGHLGVALAIFAGLLLLLCFIRSWRYIAPNQQGVVQLNFGSKKLGSGQIIALRGECGYQARTLAPGWNFVPFPFYSVTAMEVVEVGSDEMGLVIAQVGEAPPVGARTAQYKPEFKDFEDLELFLGSGGQKGKQRWVLRPGTYRIHPVAFLVLTSKKVYGIPIDPELKAVAAKKGLTLETFGLHGEQLKPILIRAANVADEARLAADAVDAELRRSRGRGDPGHPQRMINMMGIVTSQEGPPLEDGQLAGRLGGWNDIEGEVDDKRRINRILSAQNAGHKAYQDFEAFLAAGGKAGLQHDPVTEGTYYLNPWLVSVEPAPVLHVMEGEVAVIKSRVGLVEQDISGSGFKFGSIVKPGHRGLWSEPIRTGSWFFNPRCYEATIVPTRILTLYWADNTNAAGMLDENLKTIAAKSRDGFEFKVELQVQIHISDTRAPRVISMVGSIENLVNQVLQSSVGNYFRNKIQGMAATEFIQQRDAVQQAAFQYIKEKLDQYEVETMGVFLQDIRLPDELAKVLREREIASQEIETFKKQKEAQDQRIATEQAAGVADQQRDLAKSKVAIEIKSNAASARKAEADGEAAYTERLGQAEGVASAAKGKGTAEGLLAQREAVGQEATTLIRVVEALVNSRQPLMPQVLSVNGAGGAGGLDGVAATLTGFLHRLASDRTVVPGDKGA